MANFGALLPALGAGIGTIFGPAGTAVGGALGAAGAGLLAAGDKSNIQPNLGAQNAILAGQMSNLEQLQAQQGLSSAEVQRLSQANIVQRQQELQRINALSRANMSPLEKEGILRGLKTQSQQNQIQIIDKIASLDERSEARKLAAITSGSQVAAQQAQAIAQQKQQADLLNKQADAQAYQNFATAMAGIAKGLPAALEGGFKNPFADSTGAEIPQTESKPTEIAKATQIGLGAVGGSLAQATKVNDALRGIDAVRLRNGGDIYSSIDFTSALGLDDLFMGG